VLAGHFLELNRARLGLRCLRLSPDAERALLGYSWPGNIRELEHVISRAALKVLSQAESRTALLSIEAPWLGLDLPAMTPHVATAPVVLEAQESLQSAVDRYQRELIQNVLEQHGGKWAAAARALSIDPSNLRKLARRLNII
jgi:anaerobic nitric oxide reductase transcription regulator